MGDRYFLHLHCASCGEGDDDVYYAPSCGFLSFQCKKCGQLNWIRLGFHAEPVTEEECKKRMKEEGFGE
jgi:hypothetical protein